MFEGFKRDTKRLGDIDIHYVTAGSGPPLLLLHGYPQSHVMWHKVAPRLAEDFTVVVSDLRGYGDSSKPATTEDHAPYSKRETANDQIRLMASFGFDDFMVAGHDRGGRVSHRMALDHPDKVKKLAVLDIAPTYAMYSTTDFSFALAYYHWFFLIQPQPVPETMIGADPEFYLRKKFGQWGRDETAFPEEAMNEYLRCFTAETIHASCEDYRASATIDMKHDQTDIDARVGLVCPVLALWGQKGYVGNKYDVVAEWQKWATDVKGFGLPCGHYLPEEAPDETYKALLEFFRTDL